MREALRGHFVEADLSAIVRGKINGLRKDRG